MEEECPEGWSGEFCDVCEEDVFGAMCKEDCDVKGTCSGHGRCEGGGSCECVTGWKGVNCSVMEEEECPEGWSGEFCDVCEEDVFGAMCKEDCDVKGTCSGHGRCEGGGSCECVTGWKGVNCSSLNLCSFPDAATSVSGTVLSISSLSFAEDSGLVYVHNAVPPEVLCCLNMSGRIPLEFVSGSLQSFAISPILSTEGAIIARLSPDMFGDTIWELKLHSNICPALTAFDNLLSISIVSVNDAPKFDLSPTVYFQVPWGMPYPGRIPHVAYNISAGAVNEIGQPLSFHVKMNTVHDIFVSPPSIDSNGTLFFTLRQDFMLSSSFEFNISVTLSDDGKINNVSRSEDMILVVEVCGNQRVSQSETCDDGNVENGDGCTGTCGVECGYVCSGEGVGSCATVCGDGMLAGGEGCDDGNVEDGDGCSALCTVEDGYFCNATVCGGSDCREVCGDGVRTASEECDDSNTHQRGRMHGDMRR